MASVKPLIDYYAVLEVSQTDNSATIKASYHRLALLKHPDKAKDKDRATTDFQLLQEAYSTLIDPELRKVYDSTYHTVQRAAQSKSKSKSSHETGSEGPSSTPATRSQRDDFAERLRVLNLRKKDCKDRIAKNERYAHQLRFDLKVLQEEAVKIEKQKAELQCCESANKTAQDVNKQNLDKQASSARTFGLNLSELQAGIDRIRQEMSSDKDKGDEKEPDQSKESTACAHNYRWSFLQGQYHCSLCEKDMRRFAFLCPGCETIACAPCREVLKNTAGL